MSRRPVVIVGAGGRDFHVFNTCYREDATYEVVAFTAAQIPNIADRRYPPVLAGPHHPDGIPIRDEAELEAILAEHPGAHVVFAYSDVSRDAVDHLARRVQAAGGTFALFDPDATMLTSRLPCLAVCAVRTGCGKSPIARAIAARLRDRGWRVAVLRHPMPYGNLKRQAVQRFATLDDLAQHECTIEEIEEYEPHVAAGQVVYAGVDYEPILRAAEAEADVILWDGGNNDTPFVRPDLWITVLDPLRAGDEVDYFPSQWNLERADVLVINKIGEADATSLDLLRTNIAAHNPDARVVEGRLPVTLDNPGAVAGRRVLVVEDGPTATHGGMGFGAGYLAATRAGAEVIDPRPFAQGDLKRAYEDYPHLRDVVPALGYGEQQRNDLEATIAAAECDVVVVGTPIDLTRIVKIAKPVVRARYEYEDASTPGLLAIAAEYVATG
ncbi:MAG: GTPase [Planctomycetota bacterium]|nr:GTPase [Planctomycetota bacterium]